MARLSGPFWVSRPAPKFGGVDFLGLREPGLAMANRLLPGFTNFTQQARYYTVIAWIHVNAGRAERIRLLESAFVHAVREHKHTGRIDLFAMVGRNSVPFPDEGEDLLPLRSRDRERIVSAMDAPFYGPSAVSLGVAGQRGEISAFEAIARELADTVDIDPSALRQVSEKGLDRRLLAPLSALCPCEPAKGRERDLLEELLFRHEQRRTDGAQEEGESFGRPKAKVACTPT